MILRGNCQVEKLCMVTVKTVGGLNQKSSSAKGLSEPPNTQF